MVVNQAYRPFLPHTRQERLQKLFGTEKIGISFELSVNDVICNLEEFVLYWEMPIKTKESVSWELSGQFFQNKDIALTQAERNSFELDHLVITPSAVFVLESKCYKSGDYYSSGNKWYFGGSRNRKTLDNPVCQVRLYTAIIKQILSYYGVDLPVIGKAVVRYGVSSSFREENSDIIHYENLLYFMRETIAKNTRKRLEALKLLKSLYYDKCWPVVYDGKFQSWRV